MTPVILASLLLSLTPASAVDLKLRMERLLHPARVMYIAAHPDDENTQLLAYLTHDLKVRVAYLSLTRGDGGQNLIGDEQSPLLGVIRTHELLAARQIDWAEQRFTRARDFGYSKRADEALEIWGRDAVLADVVWALRSYRPHVVITRFPEKGSTHGHHLASAILAREAFEAAGDPKRFTEQLGRVAPFRARRLVFNVPGRFMPEEQRDDDQVIDIGGFSAQKGQSYGELAAASRSMHKSQGFGAPRRWGPHPERFRHLAGERAEQGLLDGVPSSWKDHEGGAAFESALDEALSGFDPSDPSASLPLLAAALRASESIVDAGLREDTRRELAALMVGASGLLLEARSEDKAVVPGGTAEVKVHVTLRGGGDVTLRHLEAGAHKDLGELLERHRRYEWDVSIPVSADADPTVLPWLTEPPSLGRYHGTGDPDVPLPPPPLVVRAALTVAGEALEVEIPVHHVWTDRVAGERRRAVEILPPITATPDGNALMVPRGSSAELRVAVRVRGAGGKLEVQAPKGYRVTPSVAPVEADGELTLKVEADSDAAPGDLVLRTEVGGQSHSLAEHPLAHRHIPEQTVLLPASVRLSGVDITVPDIVIGHVPGPGDRVPQSLRRLGFDVRDIDADTLARGDLDAFDAILVGIRAFNTNDTLRAHAPRLHAFAEKGGTVMVQYTTVPRREPLGVDIGPKRLELGRGRVTNEAAEVKVLSPDHEVLRRPHRIGKADFEGWVQERGLYFAQSWDETAYEALFAMGDDGEPEERGALLVADVGKGRFVYTGISFFRQLPAGVPGAYRLLANLLSRRGDAAREISVDAPPPVLGKWKNLYLVVGAVLVLLIGVFYLITRRYTP